MPEVPVKLYLDKILKVCRNAVRRTSVISGPVKDRALRAMADRVAQDEAAILSANERDVDALGKSFGSEVSKDRLKAAVARVRMTADDVKEMADRLRAIADQPDPVGAVTGRWERPDGLQVSRVRGSIGVIGIISELSPLVTVESIALCLKSGNVSVFRGAPDWSQTHEVIGKGLREAAAQQGIPLDAWVFIDRPEKDVAVELIRSARALDAIIPRGGAGLRKAVLEGARMPVLCHDGGQTYLYVDADVDLPLVQNVVINSKVQRPAATNALDTLLVQQGVARQFLPALINRLLVEFKIDVRGCPKTLALMGQMPISGHTSIIPAAEEDWYTTIPVTHDGRENGYRHGRSADTYRRARSLHDGRDRDLELLVRSALHARSGCQCRVCERLVASSRCGRIRIRQRHRAQQCAAPCQGSDRVRAVDL